MSLGLIDTPRGQPNKEERIDGIVDKTHNKAGKNLNLSKVWETVGNSSNLEREEGKGKSIKN